ncbi:flagellar hook-basal body protein [Sulfurimonas microaerophilic]|uniref:flagellar hook-basal body protein n=1 Tax=Sulfurimonas microaerophilic TaxID=3058392 RepID=UPI002714F93F|nr:flagellar hook-basal body protein [Sulfurimonas sp. hsl 1-7]
MQTGYYSSAAGMVTQFNRLDTIANNLANVNTAGFKEDTLIVGDFMRVLKEARDELPNANQTKEGAAFLNRTLTKAPQVVDSFTDFSVGDLAKTSNTLDFALSKDDLFFAVKTPQGIRLTRDGSFLLNEEGKLVNKQGYEVLAQDYKTSNQGIAFAQEDTVIKADKNGQIYTNVPGALNMVAGQKLLVVQPDNIKELKKDGDNLYKLENLDGLEVVDNSGAVAQGFVEKSNVNAVQMMTELIEANRLIGMYQKAMDTQMNDMNKDAIEKIAKRA